MIAASLPDLEQLDLEAAKALLIAQHETYTAALSSRTGEIQRLKLLVEKLQRMLFGTKSEKVLRQAGSWSSNSRNWRHRAQPTSM